jgi:hypothetical protein
MGTLRENGLSIAGRAIIGMTAALGKKFGRRLAIGG